MTQWAIRLLGTKEAAKKLGVSPKAIAKRIEDPMLDLKPADVGFVQRDTCEWKGRAVVIAMAQSLLAREYEPEFYESFGLLFVDEVHRFAAKEFQKAIVQFPARVRAGVTATPDRKDGMQEVFFGHIGEIVVEGEEKNKRKPRVNQVKTPVVVSARQREKLKLRGQTSFVKVVTFLVRHEARNRMIVNMLLKAAQNERKILILSDRREHLETLREMYLETCQKNEFASSWAYYVGGMNLQERLAAERMQVLGATYGMAAEGLDIPALDTLFLVTPRGPDMIEQYVGRILRLHDDKKEPVVVDFVDQMIGVTAKLGGKRKLEYANKGWL